jgi:hypothetical protein
LGSILITAIQLATLYRAKTPEHLRKPFYLYVDEFHTFLSLSFADILAEARKYKLSLFLSHQYIEQLQDKIRSAIFGNAGTIISFRVGAEDAEYLAREFFPTFSESDLVNLPKFSMYLKLMIDGATSAPFSAKTVPLGKNTYSYSQEVMKRTRKKYGKHRGEVEKEIFSRHNPISGKESQQAALFGQHNH